jgi:hypothetical protein
MILYIQPIYAQVLAVRTDDSWQVRTHSVVDVPTRNARLTFRTCPKDATDPISANLERELMDVAGCRRGLKVAHGLVIPAELARRYHLFGFPFLSSRRGN